MRRQEDLNELRQVVEARNESCLNLADVDITLKSASKLQQMKNLCYWKSRDGGQQFAGVLVRWLMQNLFRFAYLDEFPAAHHRNARCQLRHDRQAVRYKNISKVKFRL